MFVANQWRLKVLCFELLKVCCDDEDWTCLLWPHWWILVMAKPMGTLLARFEEGAKMEEIKNELQKTKWQVFGYWLCWVLERNNVLCSLLCGGRMPHLTTMFLFLEAHDFHCTLCYINAKLVVNIGAKSWKWWKAQRVSKVVLVVEFVVGVCTFFSYSKSVFLLLFKSLWTLSFKFTTWSSTQCEFMGI